jgi:hypothetical protein
MTENWRASQPSAVVFDESWDRSGLGAVYDHAVGITRLLLLLACLLGCGGEVPGPVLGECFSGDYFAECGGEGESRFGCRADGECKWFVRGMVAEEFVASTCPVDDPCCHDDWPYGDETDGFEFQSRARIMRDVYGHGTAAWNRERDMVLAVAVDRTPIPARTFDCAGGDTNLAGSPCDANSIWLDARMLDTLRLLVYSESWHGWNLWLEIDPERSLARACLYPYTDNLAERCWGKWSPVCAISGNVLLTNIPEAAGDATDVGARVELEFADGLTISGAF